MGSGGVGIWGRTLMANNGGDLPWRRAIRGGFEDGATETRCAARPRSGATCTQGGRGIPGLSPRATFRDSSGVLQGGDCVAPRTLSSRASCSCGCFPLNSRVREPFSRLAAAPPVPHFSLRGLRDLRGFIFYTKSVPKFRTSRLPRAQVKFRAHKRPDGRTECRDARTSRRTRAQIVGTPAQTLRIVAQSQG